MKIRTWVVGGLVAAMAIAGPAAAWAGGGGGGGGGGLLGGVLGSGNLLGGNLGGALGNGCKEDELVSVGGDAGLVGINLAGDLDLNHGLLSIGSNKEDDLVSVGGDAGLVGLLGNDPDLFREGLLGLATQCHNGGDW
ncbi:MAG TPA: hypothetical protein VHA57_02620 [Actinomycetota bacterium]|nr:hypothetical protein [Actinomycetota bacterium]